MAINVIVRRQGNEYTPQLLRRFTQKMRSAGIVQHMRKIRYRTRPLSKMMRRKAALERLARRKRYEKMVKEGKITPTPAVRSRS